MATGPVPNTARVVVLISAGTEWRVACRRFAEAGRAEHPFGEWFCARLPVGEHLEPVVFVHGGWGKIAAAASAQYVIDRWAPSLLVNLGTCGGFEGQVERGTILLVERTLVYDIVEQMGEPAEAIDHYATEIDLSWLVEPLPLPVRRSLLISADRDLVVEEIPRLKVEFGAIAGDWESGAIAYVAARNRTRCLILRGVSDLVSEAGGEAYGNMALFRRRTETIMRRLLDTLPAWVAYHLAARPAGRGTF
jgi:adenosylhomocysteine nucleosidase